MATILDSRSRAKAGRLVAAALLGGVLLAANAAPPDHEVGTLSRVDAGQSRMVLSRDTETGDVVGQGSPTHVYVTPATVITRSGKAVGLADLKLGERLLVAVQGGGNRLQATRVRALPSTTPGRDWGLYMHGTLRTIETTTHTVHLDQADTLNFVRIGYDAQTQAFDADGNSIPLTSLKPGDELDMAVRKTANWRMATKVVQLPPHGGP